MSKKTKQIISWVICILVVVGFVVLLIVEGNKPGKLDNFATCLKDKNATFYGAFWCQHCQNQKALFGSSQKLIRYVECSTPDARGQLQICRDKKIEGYPTWEFADGTRESGELSLSRLSEKTGCVLPE